jgi:hypothetical protein
MNDITAIYWNLSTQIPNMDNLTNIYKAENERFIIEPKYDMGVGLIAIDHNQRLVRHFEVIASPYKSITIDLYENGFIKYNILVNGYSGCMPANPPYTKFAMNLTGGKKIEEIYIKLVEGIYRPFCERIDTSEVWVPDHESHQISVPKWLGYIPNASGPTYTQPLIYEARGSCDSNIVQQNLEHLIDQTFFTTLDTVKQLHESLITTGGVLKLVHIQLQNHAKDIQRISERVQELMDI